MLKMIELPYPLNALEPYYSKETVDLHYNILYKGYVDNTNNTEEKLRVAREKRDFSNIKCLEKDLSFYGSGVILHELFCFRIFWAILPVLWASTSSMEYK